MKFLRQNKEILKVSIRKNSPGSGFDISVVKKKQKCIHKTNIHAHKQMCIHTDTYLKLISTLTVVKLFLNVHFFS